ncbi:c-type cytochrome biogenesis protein CcmI [Uliginosibacterium sediminicola]|uniref:C-type cytochrome biogenesis protein CcmI n=1 Tax=Uliginosibacterium sediminicola TaxID=2024550 RepID=A0ABU9Z1L0_9RHOO
MSAFLILAAILLCAVTAILLWPLLRARPETSDNSESPALKILREQRKELDAELAAGSIDAARHAETLAELERRALEESSAPEAARSAGPRRAWAIALALVLPLSAVGLYVWIGNPAGLHPEQAVDESAQHVTPAQIDAMLGKLAERVAANPDDLEGLLMLGRSYMVLGRFADAEKSFALLASKRPDAQTYADWADALAAAQGRSLAGKPEELINKALKLDPQNIKALALAGTVAFDRKDFKTAIKHWQKIAALVPADSEFGQSVQSMLQEARSHAGLPATADPAAKTSTDASAARPQAAANQAPALTLKGQVTLAAALRGKVSPDDSLFLFARPAAGGAPVAGMRFKASELPLEFDFSTAQAMISQVAPHDKIIVGARISKHNSPMAQDGDLQGLSAAVEASAQQPLRIEISEVVKK